MHSLSPACGSQQRIGEDGGSSSMPSVPKGLAPLAATAASPVTDGDGVVVAGDVSDMGGAAQSSSCGLTGGNVIRMRVSMMDGSLCGSQSTRSPSLYAKARPDWRKTSRATWSRSKSSCARAGRALTPTRRWLIPGAQLSCCLRRRKAARITAHTRSVKKTAPMPQKRRVLEGAECVTLVAGSFGGRGLGTGG